MNLLDYRANVTSSDGEDGVIEKIFEVIGEGSRWCVELGALNGTHDSNVWNLIRNKRWSGVLIEADQTYFEKLQQEFAGRADVECINEFVSFEGARSLDTLFAKTSLQKKFDFFSLDIDGNEYHLWESMVKYLPRVMVVEFNPSIPNNISFIQPRDMSVFQGSSLLALTELARNKGYELVAANSVNAFFVLKELFPKFDITDNAIDSLHTNREYETTLFQLYDGTLKLAGNTRLLWHNKPIDEEKIQMLSAHERKYPARISEHSMIRKLKYWARTLPGYTAIQRIRKRFF